MKLRVPCRGCSTCPYLRDTPPGIWEASEYEKLPTYDKEPHEWDDPHDGLAIFHCHQEHVTGVPTICRGWLSVHRHSVAVRLAQAFELLDYDDVPTEPEPEYYATGAEAAEAGLAGVDDPSPEARRAMDRLLRRGSFNTKDDED